MSFNDWLGLRPGDDPHSVVLDTRPEHEVVPGTVHFAVLATLAEVAAARAVGAPVVPAAVAVQLLARAEPGRLEGRGRVLRQGRRLAFAEGEVHQGGKLVAKVAVTFALL
jgi:acyl-coenzyme A thioesterase PaaI-like protein